MKKHLILFLICIVCGGGQLLAQKYQPKYLREDNKEFKNLTTQATPNGGVGRPMDRIQKRSPYQSQ